MDEDSFKVSFKGKWERNRKKPKIVTMEIVLEVTWNVTEKKSRN